MGKHSRLPRLPRKASPDCPDYQGKQAQTLILPRKASWSNLDYTGKQAQVAHISWESKPGLHRFLGKASPYCQDYWEKQAHTVLISQEQVSKPRLPTKPKKASAARLNYQGKHIPGCLAYEGKKTQISQNHQNPNFTQFHANSCT